MDKVIAIALVTCAAACSKDKGKDKPAPPAAGSAEASACPDAEIQQRLDASIAASKAYFGKLSSLEWKLDCDHAREQFLALEPDADRFMTNMLAFKTWGEQLAPACRKRIVELGEQSAAAKDFDKLVPELQHEIEPVLEQCKGQPGFDEAVAKGLRVLKKKKKIAP